MFHARRWQLAILLIGGLLLGGVGAGAQEKKAYEKHDASALNASLRDVINAGAKIYNDNGDHAGCFRMYQGALMSVKPFLAPDLQKKVDKSLAACDGLATYADRSFELRKVLDEIRDKIKGDSGSTGTTKGEKGEKGDKGQIVGTLNYQGKPVAGGYLVTLVSGGKKTSTPVQKDGNFAFKAPISVGEYRIAIEPIPDEKVKGTPLPARYASESTSGLVIRVQAGKQAVDLNLVK